MTVTAGIALFVFFVCIGAAAVLLANGIADEPPAIWAKREADKLAVETDNGEYDD